MYVVASLTAAASSDLNASGFPAITKKKNAAAIATNANSDTIDEITGNHIISLSCFKTAHDSLTMILLAANLPILTDGIAGAETGADVVDNG
jgi:hypothetical protein